MLIASNVERDELNSRIRLLIREINIDLRARAFTHTAGYI